MKDFCSQQCEKNRLYIAVCWSGRQQRSRWRGENPLSENKDKTFIDDSIEFKSQPSDYYELKNIDGSTSSAEQDTFSQPDIDDFKILMMRLIIMIILGLILTKMIWKSIVLMVSKREFKSSKMNCLTKRMIGIHS